MRAIDHDHFSLVCELAKVFGFSVLDMAKVFEWIR